MDKIVLRDNRQKRANMETEQQNRLKIMSLPHITRALAVIACLFLADCRSASTNTERSIQFRLPAVPYAVDSTALVDIQFIYPPVGAGVFPELGKK